ncbi:MAG: alpha/beta hydrolase [Bacteroidales bacterium]
MSCNGIEKNELDSGFVEVDGGKIYYETKGHGDPIVLLHPGLTDLRMWKNQVNELSESRKVVCYDQRGYGKSDLPSKNYSPNADLLALLDSLRIEKADFVGICMGALHAMEFALAYPERVNTLALSGISFSNWKYPDDVIKKHIEFSSIVTEGPDKAIETIKTDPFWKQTIPSDIYETAQKDFLDLLEENKAAFTANWQFKEQVFTIMDRISEIDKPVLVIRPGNEVDYMIEIADYLIDNIENAEQVHIKEGGHLSNMEKPEEFNKAILDFLAEHE